MTDEEMTKLCAEAMGMDWAAEQKRMADRDGKWLSGYETPRYDPLVNDAQAMALVKHFHLDIESIFGYSDKANDAWEVQGTVSGWEKTRNADLNRAIVECVANMHAASTRTPVK